jgi:hypothetical protein
MGCDWPEYNSAEAEIQSARFSIEFVSEAV